MNLLPWKSGLIITLCFVVLGAVFLVVTGGEALYADIGHFAQVQDLVPVLAHRPRGPDRGRKADAPRAER